VAVAQGLAPANIAYEQIQGRRAVKTVPIAPGAAREWILGNLIFECR